jgi:glycosyltransferase involved in cell wall biosynthesis
MRATAVVISASLWQEPLTTVIIEALSNGRPVIGTALGGTPYLIGDAGWVVEPTATAMAEALPKAAREAAALAPLARTRYEQTFTPEIVIAQLINIYRQTAAGSLPAGPPS